MNGLPPSVTALLARLKADLEEIGRRTDKMAAVYRPGSPIAQPWLEIGEIAAKAVLAIEREGR